MDSVSASSPRQLTLQILSDLPTLADLQYHSLIGNRRRPGALETSTDGIVPQGSRHLDEAVSEKIIADGHSLYDHPDTLRQIRRILQLP